MNKLNLVGYILDFLSQISNIERIFTIYCMVIYFSSIFHHVLSIIQPLANRALWFFLYVYFASQPLSLFFLIIWSSYQQGIIALIRYIVYLEWLIPGGTSIPDSDSEFGNARVPTAKPKAEKKLTKRADGMDVNAQSESNSWHTIQRFGHIDTLANAHCHRQSADKLISNGAQREMFYIIV